MSKETTTKRIKIEDVEKAFSDIYLLADDGAVRIMLATVIANRLFLNNKPVWLLFLAGSSSGKTALLQSLDNIGNWIFPIDTLTTNTFASGLQRSEETSLLHKANRGILVFKDFTTLTSMNEDALRDVMGQLRAIYDGSFDKKTGNGQDIHWIGKIGILAGGTIAVQRKMRQFSEQGERFINYSIKQPDAIEMTTRAVSNQESMKEKEAMLQQIVKDFIEQTITDGAQSGLVIPKDLEEELISVSNFSTLARSPVILDKKTNKVAWVPEREMPARMAIQLINLGKSLMIMSGEKELSNKNAKILYQCAMDSIPVERRLIMRVLTQYKSASTKNLAIHLNYPTDPVLSWCSQLNARKLVERVARGDGSSDTWILKPEYRIVMERYEHVKQFDYDLKPTDEEVAGYSDDDTADPVAARDGELLDKIYSKADQELEDAFPTQAALGDIDPGTVPL